MFSHKANEYVLLQFPVGLMGAVFDTASFFITIYIARRAIEATKVSTFLLHLSVDVIMAFSHHVGGFGLCGFGLAFVRFGGHAGGFGEPQ